METSKAEEKVGKCKHRVLELDESGFNSRLHLPFDCYCTCKENLEAHGLGTRDRVRIPLCTLYGIMTCMECRFHTERKQEV